MQNKPYTLSECLAPFREKIGQATSHAEMHQLRYEHFIAHDAAEALRQLKAASAESSQALRRVYYSPFVQSVLDHLDIA